MNHITHRSFVLHDGDNDEKNDELQAFLDQPVNMRGHDWEGSNSGISIWLSVRPKDSIVVVGDGMFLILRHDEKVKITAQTFPFVWAAMREVELDNGAHHVNRIAGEQVIDLFTFTMPYEYGVDKLTAAENALYNYALSFGPEAMCNFVTGDQDMAEENIKLHPEMRTAHDLLNAWFNGWS